MDSPKTAIEIDGDVFIALSREIKEEIINFLASGEGAEALRRALDRAKESEARKKAQTTTPEDETAKIDIPYGDRLLERAVFQELYDSQRETLQQFGFLDGEGQTKKGDIFLPHPDVVKTTFKAEEIETAKTFINPVLVLVPETSFAAKLEAVNSWKSPNHNPLKATALPGFIESDSNTDNIRGWRAYFVESDINNSQLKNDNPHASCADRTEHYLQDNGLQIKGLDRHLYIMLVMHYMRQNKSPGLIGKKVLLAREYRTGASYIFLGLYMFGNLLFQLMPSHRVCTDACFGPRVIGGSAVI